MNLKILVAVVPMVLLSACGRDEPTTQQERTLGGQLGGSYKGMLDDAKQSVEFANKQMQHTDQLVRERSQ